jgi:hypothetical protein
VIQSIIARVPLCFLERNAMLLPILFNSFDTISESLLYWTVFVIR